MGADDHWFFVVILCGAQCDPAARCCLSRNRQIRMYDDDLTLSSDRSTLSKYTDAWNLSGGTFPQAAWSAVVEVSRLDYFSAAPTYALCSKSLCTRKSHARSRRWRSR